MEQTRSSIQVGNSSASKITNNIILAGASGDLGQRIAKYLLQYGANVTALVRKGSSGNTSALLQMQGLKVVEVNYNDHTALTLACSNGSCLVSAVNGLHEVIVEAQTQLVKAAVAAGVPRVIPSDYCIDYTKLPAGSNRNLDLRRTFHTYLQEAPIAATSIFNGMFTDLLTGEAPVILGGIKRVLYWGRSNQPLDFTTIENTAEYTALAAMDPNTPRYLRIAGDVLDANGLATAASAATDKQFKLLRPGGLGALQFMIKLTRKLMPAKDDVFPPWQGMQYMHNMFSGLPKLNPLNNDRYPQVSWTRVQDVVKRAQL